MRTRIWPRLAIAVLGAVVFGAGTAHVGRVAAHGGDSDAVPVYDTDAFRHQLTAFVADLYALRAQEGAVGIAAGSSQRGGSQSPVGPAQPGTSAPGSSADVALSPGRSPAVAPSGADMPLSEMTSKIASLSDTEVAQLQEILGPLVLTWSAMDANPVYQPAAPRLGPAAYSPDELHGLEDLRTRLLDYLGRFDAYSGYGEQLTPSFTESMDRSRQTIQDMSADELSQLDQALSQVPAWETLIDTDPGQIIPPQAVASINAREPGSASAAVPLTHLHPQCADAAFGPVVTAVLNYVADTAEDLADIWSNDFFIAAAGFGVNAPNIPKIITLAIYYPLKVVALAASFDSSIAFNCNEGYHQTLMADHDLSMIERTNLISATLTAHDLDMKNRLSRVDTFHNTFRTTEIRLAIENDLLRKGDKRISLFQIPGSLCITTGEHTVCGMLETAHDIVADTIRIGMELGLDMTNPQVSLTDGELQAAAGHYKEAYTRYREAYVLAVRAEQ
jgi:hypothetical protein